MAIVKQKQEATPVAKKNMKRKFVDKKASTDEVEANEKPEKVEKVKTEKPKKEKAAKAAKSDKTAQKADKASKPAKAAKADKNKEVVDADVDDESVTEKVKKAPKSINTKPTAADKNGLNLPVSKVKTVIDNYCINRESEEVLLKLKTLRNFVDDTKDFTFNWEDVPASTKDFIDGCYTDVCDRILAGTFKTFLKELSSKNQKEHKRYLKLKEEAIKAFETEKAKTNLFTDAKFNLTEFNRNFSSDFAAAIKKDEIDLNALTDMELFNACSTILSKNNIRFNVDVKTFITAFVEFIIKQLVVNGINNCIDEKKKIIQLKHALDTVRPEFELFPFIQNTNTYKHYVESGGEVEELSASDIVDDEDASDDENDLEDADEDEDAEAESNSGPKKVRKLHFRHFVDELCRSVRMEISNGDETALGEDGEQDPLKSKYNQVNISKKIKQFCSNVIIELSNTFGSVLKIEVLSRGIKTVNYATVCALVQSSHVLYGLDYQKTAAFIQDKYNKYNAAIAVNKVERAEKKVLSKKEKASVESAVVEETA
jgi:hypothetical protein